MSCSISCEESNSATLTLTADLSMASPDRYCCIHLQPRRLRRTSRFSGAMRFLVEGIFHDQVDQQGVPGISGAGMFFSILLAPLHVYKYH